MSTTVTTSCGHDIDKGSIIVLSNDIYFNNIIESVAHNTLTIRKIKWYEDADTVFLASFLSSGLIIISSCFFLY